MGWGNKCPKQACLPQKVQRHVCLSQTTQKQMNAVRATVPPVPTPPLMSASAAVAEAQGVQVVVRSRRQVAQKGTVVRQEEGRGSLPSSPSISIPSFQEGRVQGERSPSKAKCQTDREWKPPSSSFFLPASSFLLPWGGI